MTLADARVEAAVPVERLAPARDFYENVLGLAPAGELSPGVDVLYAAAAGTALLIYERGAPRPLGQHTTVAHFVVDDVAATVRELRGRGVSFDEYDLPELKTVDGVATVGERHFAWFRDVDDNLLGVHDAPPGT
jgi:catechol 2,3-dioxygenase-like lactoylglutathione lyase family enzyme